MEFAEYIPTPKVEGVWCYDGRRKSISGTLCLTGHHMILYTEEPDGEEVWMMYKNIDAIEKRFGVDKGTLILKCKDLRRIQLTIPGVEDAMNVSTTVEILSSIVDPTLQCPYFYRPKFKFTQDGWELFSVEQQMASLDNKGDRWRITDVNSDYSVCQSYPAKVIVPSTITDAVILKSAKFRHLGRFPALSYLHKNGAALARSSQPLVGTGNRRCKDDEKLINAMLGPSHRGYVVDIRSAQSAVQAKTKGGGFESEHHYPRWKRVNMNLQSYYVQQESLIRIVEASNDKSGNMDRWLSKLESCNWMGHVKSALDAACLVAQCLDRDEWSVLVHGSEGVDSTLTVTSLAQVILDPECRTIRGFLTLIDREWIQGGHPFTDRSSHAAYSNGKQRSEGPVFSIFLESVYQILFQFPLSFEFTSNLVIDLRNHSYASQFGTFLFNNMQERIRCKVRSKTVSLWSYLLSPAKFPTYINPLYRRKSDVIWPSVAPQSLEFWEEFFTPWDSPNEHILERVRSFETEREELRYLKLKLSQKVAEIESRTGTPPPPPPADYPKDTAVVPSKHHSKEKRHHHKHRKSRHSPRSANSPEVLPDTVVTNGNTEENAVERANITTVENVTHRSLSPQASIDEILELGDLDETPLPPVLLTPEKKVPDSMDATLLGLVQIDAKSNDVDLSLGSNGEIEAS